jgi:hypothetical protein
MLLIFYKDIWLIWDITYTTVCHTHAAHKSVVHGYILEFFS